MKCNICGCDCEKAFKTKVLFKYDVQYYECSNCRFIQTENPYWLSEAYQNSVIVELDIGLISRNLQNQRFTSLVIDSFFDSKGKYLDYGGGYGMLVRLMRDAGYDFYRQDEYCANLFAKYFDVSDLKEKKFSLITSFEVFEHLENPGLEITKMLEYSSNILFSTELQPHLHPTPSTWWYFVPEGGQHVSLYTKESLNILAKKFDLHYYNRGNMHLFTKEKIKKLSILNFVVNFLFHKLVFKFIIKEKMSKLQSDFEFIKNKLYAVHII